MIKGILIGAVLVVALVGYGVIDTSTVETAGDRVKNGVNYVAQTVDEATK
jgi:hypothetical protein|tara:strand:+ start:228 stop:377 length:150 start_codon:yes stop_codon:yes gene_type:complete